ncbi:hypothetical protein DMR_13770 [Solidesulfovibrio magneticus RS-1]|uniref:Uncharacterized protein n=1 Tax=Solidesulfovibrio magneticus (strain ATCC 700980 / DSM 13731 / RS-1) TaxID=573370 RepID=C4XMS6_SOLM1|nr:hypothetical protein DMR_13770 [Solidesulfovibrio magneticus RS-1]
MIDNHGHKKPPCCNQTIRVGFAKLKQEAFQKHFSYYFQIIIIDKSRPRQKNSSPLPRNPRWTGVGSDAAVAVPGKLFPGPQIGAGSHSQTGRSASPGDGPAPGRSWDFVRQHQNRTDRPPGDQAKRPPPVGSGLWRGTWLRG